MPKFRKKPIVVEAVRFTTTNFKEIVLFTEGKAHTHSREKRINGNHYCIIVTLEGTILATSGDWIIKGVHGEFYPCKPDIFNKTYELV